MSPSFTEDDVGKSVRTANDETLGVVTDVDRETAYVDPDPEMADSVGSALEWDRSTEDAVPLGDDAVESIDDEAVTLSDDFPKESIATGATDEVERVEDRPENPETGADYTPGEPVAGTGSETAAGDAGVGTESDAAEPGLDAQPPDEPEPGAGDLDEDVNDGVVMDAAEEMDGDRERRSAEAVDPIEESGTESAPGEESPRNDLDVDPTELTDDDPNVEIRPGEDVGQRAATRGESTSTDDATADDAKPEETEPDTTPDGNESNEEEE